MSTASFLQSALLQQAGFRHAFFTRRGGVSTGPFESLNFSVSVGDDAQAVHDNLGLAARALGVAQKAILFLNQVHGVHVHRAVPEDRLEHTSRIEGDAVVGLHPSIACAVRVADCAPVLIADRVSGAVAAVHSGWRSTEQNIVAHAVEALRAIAGKRCDLVAAVGPHLEKCCFEVGPDVADALQAISPVPQVLVQGRGKRPHVDLRKILHAQLQAAGVPVSQVDHVRGCTVCDPARFFSYRRDGQRSGRLLAAIVPGSVNAAVQPS